MDKIKERRREGRLHYQLPVWFAEDFNETAPQGVMVDISSSGMAFSCSTDENCPHPGQQLTTRFSIPHPGTHDRSDMKSFTRTGHVCRVDNITNNLYRIAIQFDESPPFWNIPPRRQVGY
ncbi:hypothetical protein ES703_100765 [subsurface metagenome]